MLRLGLILLLCGTAPTAARGRQDDEELARGLTAVLSDAAGRRAARVDQDLAFHWSEGESPDPRLGAGPCRLQWTGLLMSERTGDYRFHVHLRGRVRLAVAGQVVLEGERDVAGWLESAPLPLEFDYHALEIQYDSPPSGGSEFRVYWSGPDFGLEPVAQRLFHEPKQSPATTFEEGEQWVRVLRCAACHEVASQPEMLAAAELRPGAWRRDWLETWLQAGHAADARDRRMPDLGLSPEEARAVAAWLSPSATAATDQDAGEAPAADLEAGQRLFLSRGCLACHRYDEMGAANPFAGSDLSRIGEKRPAAFFAQWLTDPAALNANHRMPVFDLAEQEVQQLALFLARQGDPPRSPVEAAERELQQRGRAVFEERGCRACHAQGDAPRKAIPAPSLAGDARWENDCLGAPRPEQRQPGYRLAAPHREAIRHYFEALAEPAAARSAWNGARVLREHNCLSCHARGESSGVAAYLDGVLRQRPELAPLAPGLRPPSLQSVGDKLHEPALLEAISAKNPRRDWLEVRMPRFRMSAQEQESIVRRLVEQDRLPPHPAWRPPGGEAHAAIEAAGRRLVTADGFGCTSCHAVGRVRPVKNAPLNTLGPNLAELGQRIRRPWYERWVRNPARMVPRMEMPSLKAPVHGVLDDDLDQQIAAVWTVLNDPNFRPPEPNPVRTLRRSGLAADQQPAVLATDVLRADDKQFVKPLVLALPNRHNFLFDLERAALRRWWLGDAARQRTEGKTWFWEVTGRDFLEADDLPEILWKPGTGEWRAPMRRGQFATELDSVRHLPAGGVELEYRLKFPSSAGQDRWLRVREQWLPQFAPLHDSASNLAGAIRTVAFQSEPPDGEVLLRIPGRYDSQTGNWRLADGAAWIAATDAPRWRREDAGVSAPLAKSDPDPLALTLHYRMQQGRDAFPQAPQLDFVQPPEPVNVTPGFESTRLAVSPSIMPTGLAWRPAGGLVVTSLKGRVWLLEDSDQDGLEDRLRPFGDEYAAPYGAATGPGYVDVINKYALLRLHDHDGDGVVERWETLASGWGHTADYHDWTVGLVREQDGAYLVATACQQDDRDQPAAAWRGEVLRLAPRTPDFRDPRRFQILPVSGGHRFPMGIARNRDGVLVVTDNQGNYNPFNELNHVLPGRRYGFLNKLERRPGFDPPLTPPAVNIPHPWTRSVNGVCFLETPEEILRERGPQFGPWEGDLIGCEYDSRRLVRMTLQWVGEELQGAVYPFSYYHPVDGQVFLGPLVCAVSPQADLYVGGIRDSGWGGSNNVGELVRMRPRPESIPAGLDEVRATAEGFELHFTGEVDAALAAAPDSYRVSSYRRVATPEYGGPDRDRRREDVLDVEVSADRRMATLRLPELRAGFVYEFRIRGLVDQGEFFPAEAFYTLNQIPPPGAESAR